MGTLGHGLATVSEFFVSGQLSGLLEFRRTQKMIDSLSEHSVVYGYGRAEHQVARDLPLGTAEAFMWLEALFQPATMAGS